MKTLESMDLRSFSFSCVDILRCHLLFFGVTLRLQEENVAWFPVIVGFWSTFKSTHTHRVLLHFPFSIWKTICANVVVISWAQCILGEFQDLPFCRWGISKISPRTRSVLSLENPEKTARPCQILFGVFFVFVWWNTWLIFQEVIPKSLCRRFPNPLKMFYIGKADHWDSDIEIWSSHRR